MRVRGLPWTLAALVVLALGAAAGPAQARKAGAGKDHRPNILVVMTDDQTAADVAKMPNVKRLLARQGTTFVDAVDSFPLCCPSRATFITGQYAHNHGVAGNFYPYGWYGMKGRRNTLPRWLQKAGYRTALIGKWLNGYGARDNHGEVPKGFDIWRGLLDLSAYDYYNFVMNLNGRLKSWGDPAFARNLVRFANIEVTPNPGGLSGVLRKREEVFGPPPYKYWGAERRQDYSPDVTGRVAEELVRRERRSKKPFFIWWAPAAPHREDVAVTLMGRPGPDPRAPKRYLSRSLRFKLPRGPSFNEADLSDKPSNMTKAAKPMTDEQIRELELDYQGRMGSLLAVDDHVRRLLSILRSTKQLKNTMVVFTSDNGWLQGQHRITGDKFLPYEESLRVPLIFRGPGVPRRQTIRGQISNVDFAPTLLDFARARSKARRRIDGVSLRRTIRNPRRRPSRALGIEALAPLFEGDVPVNAWDRPYKGVRTDRYTYVVYTETGEQELYDRRTDPDQLRNVAADPAFVGVKSKLARQLRRLERCRGGSCNVRP